MSQVKSSLLSCWLYLARSQVPPCDKLRFASSTRPLTSDSSNEWVKASSLDVPFKLAPLLDFVSLLLSRKAPARRSASLWYPVRAAVGQMASFPIYPLRSSSVSSRHEKNPKGSVKVAGYQVERFFVAFLIKDWLVLGLFIQAYGLLFA